MNRHTLHRWINEYLDGEIGLADKAELERLMAEDPALHKEYKELRRIGLFLGSIPEVQVHPYRFRQRMQAALDNQRGYITPQRAFSAAMLIFMLVLGLTFGLFVYQQRMLSSGGISLGEATPRMSEMDAQYRFDLVTGVKAEDFLNRITLESALGMADRSLVTLFITQTRVFEGATCVEGGGMQPLKFPASLPSSLFVKVSPQQALALAGIASDLAGMQVNPSATSPRGETSDLKTYIASHPGSDPLPLHIVFK